MCFAPISVGSLAAIVASCEVLASSSACLCGAETAIPPPTQSGVLASVVHPTAPAQIGIAKIEILQKSFNFSNKMLLQLKNIRKYFPVKGGFFQSAAGYVKAVDGVDLVISPGENQE
jgi:ABC-type glutathione transport system ATPase component